MSFADLLAMALVLTGALFFLAGTAGLLRFPDTLSRLHALTKADSLGLGLTVAGLAVQSGSLPLSLKLILIWLLALLAGSTVCHLVADHVRRTTLSQTDDDSPGMGL